MKWLQFLLITLFLSLQYKLWFGNSGIQQQNETELKAGKLILSNEKLSRENQALSDKIIALKERQAFIEEVARLDIGLVKEGEIYYQFGTGNRSGS